MISEKQVPQFEDFLMFWFIFVETFQILALGPEFGFFNSLISNLSMLISLNFTKSDYFRNEHYWFVYYLISTLGYTWVLLCILSNSVCVGNRCRFLRRFEDYLAPFMANYLFIPIIVGLLSIISCDQAVGDGLTDSFFYYDCSVFCWTRTHFEKVLMGSLLFVFYVPVACYYRIRWQQTKTGLLIKANPFYLLLKNILLVVLIVFNRLVKDRSQLTYSILFGLGVLCMVLSVWCKKAFNYDRANLWIRMMTVCVFWSSGVSIVSQYMALHTLILFVMQVGGWTFLLNVGIWLNSRLPDDLLDPDPKYSISSLFKFAFNRQPLDQVNIASEPYSLEIETARAPHTFNP